MEGARKTLAPLILLLVGCQGTSDAPYPTYAKDPLPYVPNPNGGNAFDAYVLAAGEADSAIAGLKNDPLHRTFFTPQQREDLLKALGPALRRLSAAKGACDFRYEPVKPGNPLPGRSAWRLLGRALRWRIDDDLAAGNFDAAIDHAAVAFRFGADLCGGGPYDRTLGAEIADDARMALLPALQKLGKSELRRLANVVKASLERRPSLEKTLANGDEDMTLALQWLVDAHRKGDYASVRNVMGKEARDLETSLKERQGVKRNAFFESLDSDLQRLSKAWHEAAAKPRSERSEILDVRLTGERPRRAFARHFFLIGKPLLDVEDRSLARLRLLILEAELRRVVLIASQAPKSLAAVKSPWATDPYTGRTFGYIPDGAEFRVYSVGPDLKDDLGETDSAGLSPDIRTVIP